MAFQFPADGRRRGMVVRLASDIARERAKEERAAARSPEPQSVKPDPESMKLFSEIQLRVNEVLAGEPDLDPKAALFELLHSDVALAEEYRRWNIGRTGVTYPEMEDRGERIRAAAEKAFTNYRLRQLFLKSV